MTDPNLRFGHLEWTSGMIFTAGAPGEPTIVLDGKGNEGPGPMVGLLLAVGGCAGCAVPVVTESGPAMKRVCVDGPVFDANAVFPPAA